MAESTAKKDKQEMVSIPTADLSNIVVSLVQETMKLQAQQKAETAPVGMQNRFAEIQRKHADYFVRIANDKRNIVIVEIPKLFIPYLGQNLTVMHNGSVVKIPVDGQPHYVHRNFASVIKRKLNHVSEKVSKAQNVTQTGQVGDIFEVSR